MTDEALGTCEHNHAWYVPFKHPKAYQCIDWRPLPVQTDEPPTKEPTEPVTVDACWQALCSRCGWHTPPTSPKSWVNEMAAAHRESCPNKEQMDVA